MTQKNPQKFEQVLQVSSQGQEPACVTDNGEHTKHTVASLNHLRYQFDQLQPVQKSTSRGQGKPDPNHCSG